MKNRWDTEENIVRFARSLGGNRDHIPPYIIPYRGFTIKVNHTTMRTYSSLLYYYEGHSNVTIKEGRLWIDGRELVEYSFNKDYYMMKGDNRPNSSDSTFWGPVPEDHIYGKALFRGFNTPDPNDFFLVSLLRGEKINWRRIGTWIY